MATIKDIAASCKVAVSTVSRVLNDHPDVSPETRARVLNAARELHYVPNNAARDLASLWIDGELVVTTSGRAVSSTPTYAVRGKAYRYAFYSVMIYEALLLALEIGQITRPLPSYILHFAGIIVGCIVLAGYCIWKDVYWGLNNNRKRYAVIFLVTAALNAIPVVPMIAGKTTLDSGWLNVIVLIMLAVIGIELIIKEVVDRREAEK